MFTLPLLICFAQVEIIPSADFSRKLQLNAVAATVRIANATQKSVGSGVIVGRKGDFIYILTARHLVEKGGQLDVSTFTTATYPKPTKVYAGATVAATSKPIQDLALVRVTSADALPGSLPLCPAQLEQDRKGQALSVGCAGGMGSEPTCLLDTLLGQKKVQREEKGDQAVFWEVDRKHVAGRSGGPLIDARGYLIGICSGTSQEKSYFIHAKEIRAFLESHGFNSSP